ncbi:hypothetical protein FRB99_002583 [Tulasnella sp. 403]|nr:hypothetical protein FRB99_002583 [Tulasnella sp. 403]
MVVITSQVAAVLAAVSVSGASAAALPRTQVTMSIDNGPQGHGLLRRGAVPPLPASIAARMGETMKADKREVSGLPPVKDAQDVVHVDVLTHGDSETNGPSGDGLTVARIEARDPKANEQKLSLLGVHVGTTKRASNASKPRMVKVRKPDAVIEQVEKRALINIGKQHDGNARLGSLLRVKIGKRDVLAGAHASEEALGSTRKAQHAEVSQKRALLVTEGDGPVSKTIKYLASLVSRSDVGVEARHHHHHHHDHHHRRDSSPLGVEGVIDIISGVIGSLVGEKLASLMLSSDPETMNSFVLNASNSNATHVFLVPANSTAATTSDDGTIPVALRVPVYSPDQAEMVAYCVTYDPNPPSPSPLTAVPCTDEIGDHSSQIFSYNPSSGVILPMWTVSPSSTDPSEMDDAPADGTTSATASASASPASAADVSATASASPSSTASPQKRDETPYVVHAVAVAGSVASDSVPESTEDVSCEDVPDGGAAAEAVDSAPTNTTAPTTSNAAPKDVTLVFTPSNAAGVLSSSLGNTATTTLSPPAAEASNDDEVDGGSDEADAQGGDDGKDDAGDDGDDDGDDSDAADEADAQPTTTAGAGTATPTDGSASPASATPSSDSASSSDPSVQQAAEVLSDGPADSVGAAAVPSMTPVADASTPYSWMFTPRN